MNSNANLECTINKPNKCEVSSFYVPVLIVAKRSHQHDYYNIEVAKINTSALFLYCILLCRKGA